MIYNSNNGYDLYYEMGGEGIPFVFLHGLGGSINQIKNTYNPISGFKLIMIDQQGHGKSSSIDDFINFNQMANDVIDILDHLKINKFIIGGISMGAAVSLNVALNYPDRVLKLITIRNAWIDMPMDERFIRIYDLVAKYLKHNDKDGFLKEKDFINLKNESMQASNSLVNYFSDSSSLQYYKKYQILPKDRPITSLRNLNNLNIPSLILENHNDPIHNFDYSLAIANNINNSIFKEITSKDIDASAHKNELNNYLHKFLNA